MKVVQNVLLENRGGETNKLRYTDDIVIFRGIKKELQKMQM